MSNDRVPVCECGSLRFNYGLVMFPMVWMAVCRACGKETTCHLKIAETPPKKPPKPYYPYDPYGDWPFG